MKEEQLADLLTEYLDAFVVGEPLSQPAPDEIAGLLAAAQTLFEAAPGPRPEFGPALKISLLEQTSGGNGAAPASGSIFNYSTLIILMAGLLATVTGLGLLVNQVIFAPAESNLLASPSPTKRPDPSQILPAEAPTATPAPARTQPAPKQRPSLIRTLSIAPPPSPTITSTPVTELVVSPSPSATPIIDVLPIIIVTVEIDPPPLIPGPGSGGGDDGRDDGGDDGGNGGGGNGNDGGDDGGGGGNGNGGGGGRGDGGNGDGGDDGGGDDNGGGRRGNRGGDNDDDDDGKDGDG